jgi:DNA polymerase delta subunit 1
MELAGRNGASHIFIDKADFHRDRSKNDYLVIAILGKRLSLKKMSPTKRAICEQFDSNDEATQRLSPKRLRGGGFHDDDFGGDYDDENDLFDDDLLMEHNNENEPEIPDEFLLDATKVLPETDQQRWKRPDIPSDLSNKTDLDFLWVDMDVVTGKPLNQNPNSNRSEVVGSSDSAVPVLRTYGVTDEGYSVTAFIHGFTPYGYFAIPPGYTLNDTQSNMNAIRDTLNARLMKERSANNLTSAVLAVIYVKDMKSMYGFDTPDTQFLKVFVALPSLIPALKRIMEDGIALQGVVLDHNNSNRDSTYQLDYPAFECNVPFVLRFMVDRSLAGAGWLTLPAGTYHLRQTSAKETHCQVS